MDNKVIVDGVDVGGCEYYDEERPTLTCTCEEYPCSECPNCYFKQLKRKEQECEELKKMNETGLQRWVDMYNKADKERFEAVLQRDRYKQALDERNRKNKGRL